MADSDEELEQERRLANLVEESSEGDASMEEIDESSEQ